MIRPRKPLTSLQVGGGYLLAAASVLLTFVFPYVQARYGMDWGDTPYHLLFYTGQRESSNVFTFFTPWVGQCWGSAFGFDVMSFRVLDMTCLILMHVLPLTLLFQGAEDAEKRVHMAAVGMLMAVNVTLNVYGYDSFSMFVFSLIFMCGHAFIFTGRTVYAAGLGILTGISVAARLPNALTAFTLTLTILAAVRFQGGSWSRAAARLAAFVVPAALTYVLLYAAYHYTRTSRIPWNVASSILHSIQEEMMSFTKLRATHSIDLLARNMLRDVGPILGMTLSIGIVPLVWESSSGRMRSRPLWIVFGAALGFAALTRDTRLLKTMLLALPFLLMAGRVRKTGRYGHLILLAGLMAYFIVVFKVNVWDSTFRRKYLLLVSSASITLCVGYLLSSWKRGERLAALFSVFCFLLAFNMPIGSNTGLWKSASIFTFTAPVLFLLAFQKAAPETRTLMASMAAVLAALSLAHKTVVSKTFMDGRISDMTMQYEHPLLQGIHTTPVRKQNLDEMMHLLDSVQTAENGIRPILTGGTSQLLQYLSGQPEPIPYALFTDISRAKVEELSGLLLRDTTLSHVLVTYYYPEEPRKKPAEMLMHGKLLELGFQITREGVNYQLFSR